MRVIYFRGLGRKLVWQNAAKAILFGAGMVFLAAAGYTVLRYLKALQAGSPQSGSLARNATTPTPYTLADGVTRYCLTRDSDSGPPESYFVPNNTDAEFNAFKNANPAGVTIIQAPAAGTEWIAGSCCSSACRTKCGTEADGNCGRQDATRGDPSCTADCTPDSCCGAEECSNQGKNNCQWDVGDACYTMCCTGGGCPSYACTTFCSSRGGVQTTCSYSQNICTCVNTDTYDCSLDTCASC
jgi:hypothetical protein